MTDPDPLIEFAAALRAVREAAGDVPSAELAQRAGIDETVLGAALSGGMLPSLGVTMAIVQACGATPAGWEAKWREVAAAHLAAPAPSAPSPPSAPAAPPRPNAAPSVGRPPAPNTPPPPAYPAAPAGPPAPVIPAAPPTPPPPTTPPIAATTPPPSSTPPVAEPEPTTPRPQPGPEAAAHARLEPEPEPAAAESEPAQPDDFPPAATEAPAPPATEPPVESAPTTIAPIYQAPPTAATPDPTQPNPNLANAPAPAPTPPPTTHSPTVQPPVVERPPAQRTPDQVPDTTRGRQVAPAGPSWDGPDRAVLARLEPDDPRTVGGYVLRARLGSGGMGRVYLSYTPGGRPVAIKVIRGEFAEDPEFRRRFRQEVAAAQRVQGLYTAPVIDTDAEAEQPWLATAYVAGPSLYEAVYRYGPLPAETVLILLAGVAEALQSVHSAGVVHRDLKPSNVILAADGPRVIDFGIARAADATPLTRTGMSIGTPAFMAPEQARGLSSKPATDVFALGSLGVYAATGTSAFGEGTDSSVLYRVVHQEPDLSGVPEELLDVLRRCLEKDPALRPTPTQVIELCRSASAGTRLQVGEGWLPATLVEEVTRRVNEQPPKPPKDPAVGRRRKRRALLAVVTVLVLAAAGGGLALGLHNKDDKGDKKGNAANDVKDVNAPTTQSPGAPGPSGGSPTSRPNTPTSRPTTSSTSTSTALPSIATQPGASATAIPTAGGVAEGGVLFERELDVPDGYCIGLGYTSTWKGGCDAGSDAGNLFFYGDSNYVQGKEMVLLDPGQVSDFPTCLADTRYASNNQLPYTYLKVGSVICLKDGKNGLVGTVRVNAVPGAGTPSKFWKVSMTVWRGPRD
jgi:serine/threonine protein kinase